VKILYLDPFSGIAGDMLIGALVDLGLDLAKLHHELAKLKLTGYHLTSKKVMRGVMAATKFDVEIDGVLQKNFDAAPPPDSHDHGHSHGDHGHSHAGGEAHSHTHAQQRSFGEIKTLISGSDLSARVKEQSIAVFTKLAEAEGRIHNYPIDKVHFHEVGAIDSIVDVIGACVGLEALGIDEVWCAPVALGSGGYVKCDHGLLPAPAPATVEIMKGIPVRPSPVAKELTTPTGAALVAGLAKHFGGMPAMRIEKVGYGAGSREQQEIPNILRVVVGTAEAASASGATADTVLEIQANIDDSTPEVLGYVAEKILAAGALDVFFTSIQMKKSRPGVLLTVIADVYLKDTIAALLLTETSSFGLRFVEKSRLKLSRRIESVQTPFGPIHVKLGSWQGRIVSRHPEFDDCRKAAETKAVPLQTVIEAARRAATDAFQN
jgi:uncharacterized protein (TIGR00299 family) protein